MRMRYALLLCVVVAACGRSNSDGDPGHYGIKNNRPKQPCAIVVQFDGTNAASVPDPASCSSDADVLFVFVNGDSSSRDFTIDPGAIYEHGNPQHKENPFNKDAPVTITVPANSVAIAPLLHTKLKNQLHYTQFKYTVTIGSYVLDPEIDIMN